jgi:hypothetical protein
MASACEISYFIDTASEDLRSLIFLISLLDNMNVSSETQPSDLDVCDSRNNRIETFERTVYQGSRSHSVPRPTSYTLTQPTLPRYSIAAGSMYYIDSCSLYKQCNGDQFGR